MRRDHAARRAVVLAPLDRLALVELGLAAADAEQELHAAALEVELERNERVALALRERAQAQDFAPVQQQAPAKKVITEDKVQVIVDWAKKNGKTIDDVASMYDFESDTVKQAIIDALYDDLP